MLQPELYLLRSSSKSSFIRRCMSPSYLKITFPRFLASLNIFHMRVYWPYFPLWTLFVYYAHLPITVIMVFLLVCHPLPVSFTMNTFSSCYLPLWEYFLLPLHQCTFFKHCSLQFCLVKLPVFFLATSSVTSIMHPQNRSTPSFISLSYLTPEPVGKEYVISACPHRTYFSTFLFKHSIDIS